jgi:hypothetical protein
VEDRLVVAVGSLVSEVSFAEIDEITIEQILLTVKLRNGNVVEFSEDYLEFGQFCVGVGGDEVVGREYGFGF